MNKKDKKYLSFIPIPALVGIVLALYLIVKPSLFYEPSWLLPITNTIFVTVVFFVVAYIAMRNYKATGRIQILLLGCGVLAFGIGGVVAGFLRSIPNAGANLNVTIYNTAALIGAVFHFAAACILLAGIAPEVGSQRKLFWLVFSYVGLTVFMALFTMASLGGIIPPFFVQGVGPTALRQWVLGSADILFAFSFLIFMGSYLRNREAFLYWYSSALALTSISLTAFFIQSAVGSPIGWAGRFSQYLGGIYFLIAVTTAIRSAQVRRTSFDDVLTASLSPGEEKFRALAEHSPDMIARFDREMKHIYANRAGLKLYGRPAGSIIGKGMEETRLPEFYVSHLRETIQKVFQTGQPIEMEDYVAIEDGTRFYQSRCVPEFGVDGAVVNVLVVSRDLTERKQAEEALHERENWLVADLNAMTRLQKIGTLFVREGNLESVLGEIVEAAIAVSGADFGNIQLLDPKSSDLHIVAQRGFPTWWLNFWNKVAEGQGACGTALERGGRVIVEDIEQSPIFVGTPALEIQLKAGVRAVQYTPLVSRSGKFLGMFSTHYKTPHRPDGRALRLLDLLARQAADLIEYVRAEEALREAYERATWLARLPEQNPNPVMRASGDGTVLYCNPACAKHRGWKSEVGQVLPKELFPLVSRAMAEEGEVHEDVQLNGRVYIIWVEPFPGEGYANIYGRDITDRKQAEGAMQKNKERFEILSETASRLLLTVEPQKLVNELCRNVMTFLDCHTFFNYLVDEEKGRLHLNAYAGIPEETGKEIEWLDYGVAVCGCAARDACRIVAEDIPNTPDIRTELVKSFGIKAYACHPLFSSGRVIGTLSFGTRSRTTFTEEELLLMKTIADQVAIAMERMKLIEALKKSRDELEMRVQERTQELAATNEQLRAENEERLRVEIELRESENRLRELSTALLSAQERERKLIAGEIHDSLGASLAATKFKVEAALKEMGKGNLQTKAALESVVPIIQGTIEESRRIQMSLRPSMLDDLGILATINWFCRQFESTYSHIRQEIDIEESEVPDSLKTVIYRLLQETMNNIAKHSKADSVNLLLRKMDGVIELGIQDNGQGFDVEEASSRKGSAKGLGLDSMRERAELSGGSFLIESSKRAGTMIRASWPLNT